MTRLMQGGLAPDTPAAVIEWGTRAAQRTLVGTIASIGTLAEQHTIKPPVIAVVGNVVSLRDRLNWFERKPLFGRRIVMTRPRAQAAEFAELLEAWGAEVLPFPTIETVPPVSWEPLDAAIRRASEFDWVVFTSANGVRVFFDRIKTLGLDIRDWAQAQVAAIGPQTAKAVEAYCVRVAAVAHEFRAEGIVAALAETGVAGKRILLPRAAGAREVLPRELRRLGARVEDVATYSTVVPHTHVEELRRHFAQGEVDLVTFTSSSTVHNFVAAFGGNVTDVLTHAVVGCIGPVTAETVRSYGLQVAVQPQTYTIPAFVDAIVQHYARDRGNDAAR